MGAGVGGLAAAHRLALLAAERGSPLDLVVLEASDRAGGVVGTEAHEGALLERGPDTLVTHKPAGVELCRRLGLGDRLVHLPAGGIDILHRGRLLPVPAGFALLAPTRRWPLLSSPLLGWRGKLRALGEPLVSRGGPAAGDDESVASFVRRRFGEELLERIVEPIVGAIYMADVERLSLAATFPRFLTAEREHGSVAAGLRQRPPRRTGAAPAEPAAVPVVAALSGGLGQIVSALVARLPEGCLRLRTRVERLRRDGQGWALELADGRSLSAAAVLIAAPAPSAALLLRDLDPELAAPLAAISYASCATVHLAWRRPAVARPPRNLGFFVPRSAGLAPVAGSFVNVKFPTRAPADQVVARLFLGGAARPEVDGRTDAELVEIAAGALAPLLGARGALAWSRVFRHRRAMPQLAVGHLALVARARARLDLHPGLELAGGPVGAYGLPDAIAAGEAAAARLLEALDALRAPGSTACDAQRIPRN